MAKRPGTTPVLDIVAPQLMKSVPAKFKAYYGHFAEPHVCDEHFVEMAKLIGMKNASRPEDCASIYQKSFR